MLLLCRIIFITHLRFKVQISTFIRLKKQKCLDNTHKKSGKLTLKLLKIQLLSFTWHLCSSACSKKKQTKKKQTTCQNNCSSTVSNNCPAYSQCTQPHPIHVVFLNLVLQSMTSRHKSDEKMCFVCSCRFMFASICLTKLIIIKKSA